MKRLTISIGGPKHGELVNWPMEYPGAYWILPVLNAPLFGKHYYRAEMINLFGQKIYIWVSEDISHGQKEEKLAELLLPEILSYKGARILDYANYKFDKESSDGG